MLWIKEFLMPLTVLSIIYKLCLWARAGRHKPPGPLGPELKISDHVEILDDFPFDFFLNGFLLRNWWEAWTKSQKYSLYSRVTGNCDVSKIKINFD